MRKLMSLIVIFVLLFIIFNLGQKSLDSYNKLKEVNSNQADLKTLQIKNDQLKKELQFRQSDFSIEKEARDKLGFGKSGETAIVIQGLSSNTNPADSNQKGKSNLEKWLQLLKISL